jgi:hypothetical protein
MYQEAAVSGDQQFYFYKIYDKKRDGTGNISGAVEPV